MEKLYRVLRDDDPRDEVGEDAAAECEDQDQSEEPDDRRIDVEIFSDTVADACNHASFPDSVEFLCCHIARVFDVVLLRIVY